MRRVTVTPDDEIHRFRSVWLGPVGFGLPFHARYRAYLVFVATFAAILTVKALTPLTVNTPPVWEVIYAVLATSWVMSAVDHDKPVGAVLTNALHARRHRPPTPTTTRYRASRVKITRSPL